MKVKFKIKKEFDLKTLRVSAGVRHWEDTTVNGVEDETGSLIPCKDGDRWCLKIDIETGQILNWTQGTTAEVHYKVCDDGEYSLHDENGEVVKTIHGYVPDMMCPKEEGYGDYIIMDIDENGFIAEWKPTFQEFKKARTT